MRILRRAVAFEQRLRDRVREAWPVLLARDFLGFGVTFVAGPAAAAFWIYLVVVSVPTLTERGEFVAMVVAGATGAVAILRLGARVGGAIRRRPRELREAVEAIIRETDANLERLKVASLSPFPLLDEALVRAVTAGLHRREFAGDVVAAQARIGLHGSGGSSVDAEYLEAFRARLVRERDLLP